MSDHALVIPETVSRSSEGFTYTDVEGLVERGWCCVELLCVLHLGKFLRLSCFVVGVGAVVVGGGAGGVVGNVVIAAITSIVLRLLSLLYPCLSR